MLFWRRKYRHDGNAAFSAGKYVDYETSGNLTSGSGRAGGPSLSSEKVAL